MRRLILVGVALAGCGDGSANRTGADAAIDAEADTAIDADTPPTTVTVWDYARNPLPGAMVYFQDRDSNIVAIVASDAQGRATAVVPAGGFISYVDRRNPGFVGFAYAWTYGNIIPGEELNFEWRGSEQPRPLPPTVLPATTVSSIDQLPAGARVRHDVYLASTDPVAWNSSGVASRDLTAEQNGTWSDQVSVPSSGTVIDDKWIELGQASVGRLTTWAPAGTPQSVHASDVRRGTTAPSQANDTAPITWTEDPANPPAGYVYMWQGGSTSMPTWQMAARVTGPSIPVPTGLPSGSPNDPPIQMSGFPGRGFAGPDVMILATSTENLMPHMFRKYLWDNEALPPGAAPSGTLSYTVWSHP